MPRDRLETRMTRIAAVLVGALLIVGLVAPVPALAHYNGNDSVWTSSTTGRHYICVYERDDVYSPNVAYALRRWHNDYGVRTRNTKDYTNGQCRGAPITVEVRLEHWGSTGPYADYYRKWWHDRGYVRLNVDAMGPLSVAQRRHVIVHEFGHALGLDHPPNGTTSVMDDSQWYYLIQYHDKVDYCGLWRLSSMCDSWASWD